jgi:hypothetical protein
MKKKFLAKKLTLAVETIRHLGDHFQLKEVRGASYDDTLCEYCSGAPDRTLNHSQCNGCSGSGCGSGGSYGPQCGSDTLSAYPC